MIRYLGVLCLTAATLLGAAAQADDCRRVVIKKKFVEIPDCGEFDFCETWSARGGYGPGTFTLKGKFDWCQLPPDTAPIMGHFFCVVRDDFVARNGDELWARNAVSGNQNSPLGAGLHIVEGGSGRFAGATGILQLLVDNERGTATIRGEICGVDSRHWPRRWREEEDNEEHEDDD